MQVVGIRDDKYGEEIVAWVKCHPGQEGSDEQLGGFCKGRFAHF